MDSLASEASAPLALDEELFDDASAQRVLIDRALALSCEVSERGGSLEDLVNSFDERISKCFRNPRESTDGIAPVQVRSEEEIMNESQVWWTLTGNFGNIMPLDFCKSACARKMQLPALNLRERKDNESDDAMVATARISDEEDDAELAAALDMHSLIVHSTPGEPPPQTAEQVIDEINEMLDLNEACEHESTPRMSGCDLSGILEATGLVRRTSRTVMGIDVEDPVVEARAIEMGLLAADTEKDKELKLMSLAELSKLLAELESLIQIYNETLVQELALKDELEFEKELKNAFISLLLAVQNKRRVYEAERKRKMAFANSGSEESSSGSDGASPRNGQLPQFMTAVIPYDESADAIDCATIQTLVKILKAVNDDSSNVPSLLTDYILKVLCPSDASSQQLSIVA